MSAAIRRSAGEVSLRCVGLWICLALFLLRVLGQIEVWLIAPEWLPPMDAWHSGLLPYSLLLPGQIVLLMVMAMVAARETYFVLTRRRRPQRWHRIARYAGYAYFLAMFLRLVFQWWRGARDLVTAGAIPVVFHWVLALFIVLLARKTAPAVAAEETTRTATDIQRAAVDLPRPRPLRPAQPLAMDRARRSAERSLRR